MVEMNGQRMWWALVGAVVCVGSLGVLPGHGGTNITLSSNGGLLDQGGATATTNTPPHRTAAPAFETDFDNPLPAAEGGAGLLTIGAAPSVTMPDAPQLPATTPPATKGAKLLDVQSLPIGVGFTNAPAPVTVTTVTPATTTNAVRSTTLPWLRPLRTTTDTTTASTVPTNNTPSSPFKPLHNNESVLDKNYEDPYAYPMRRE